MGTNARLKTPSTDVKWEPFKDTSPGGPETGEPNHT